jgi:peroxiredoxin
MGAVCGTGGGPAEEETIDDIPNEPPPLKMAKNFIANDITGTEFSLSNLEGRNFILFFFSAIDHAEMKENSLQYARYIQDAIRQLEQGSEPMDFVVVGVQYYHYPEYEPAALAFRDEIGLKLDYMLLDDEDSTIFTAYRAEVPEVIFCNAGFRQVCKSSGAGDERIIDNLVTNWQSKYRRGTAAAAPAEPVQEEAEEPADATE